MIKFALKLLIFIIPFLILITIEVFIDPFNYFSEEKDKEMLEKKENISFKTNPYLYKLIKYDRNPCSTIILGDSRMDLLNPSKFEKIEKEKVSNLAIGAGTLQDAIEILNYITYKHDIKKIYWGISIETYNGTRLRNRAKSSIEIKNSLPSYLLNRYTFSATMLICRSFLFNEQIDLYKPPFSKDVFWQNQLDLCSRYLGNYSYPENYFKDLKKIADNCLEKNIKLVFVLPPTHIDLQKKIHEFNLDEEVKRFKIDLESFGDVYDFNYPNVITNDKNNFNDPFHFKDSISNIIVQEISTNKIQYSKFTSFVK
ncbi:MAG: hypothetical protein ABR927_07605 [Bacteroidales bacterium]|jgi:hypothetical protein